MYFQHKLCFQNYNVRHSSRLKYSTYFEANVTNYFHQIVCVLLINGVIMIVSMCFHAFLALITFIFDQL